MTRRGKHMKIIKPILAGVSTLLICVLLMTAVNLIPTENIQKNAEATAEYLKYIELFHYTSDDYIHSVQDNYADAKWMGVVYSIDPQHPFTSAVWARYAQLPYENINESYYNQVHGMEDVNATYSRYWHGAMIYIRPLLLVTDLSGIRIILGTVILILTAAIIFMLIKMRGYAIAGCYAMAFFVIHPWMFFKALEYSSVFVVVSAVSLVMLILIKKDLTKNVAALFAISGVLSNFVDFLTVETLSFTLPMLFLLIYMIENDRIADSKAGITEIIKNGIAWFGGYAGAFVTKLLLVLIICGKEEVQTALSVAAERVYGEVHMGNMITSPAATTGQRFSGAIWRNIAALFYTHAYKMSVQNTIIAAGGILIISVIVIYLFRVNTKPVDILPLVILALLPYARYLALSSHSFAHYFFTYRAQLVTVTVLFYLLFEHGLSNVPFMTGIKRGKRNV